VVTRDFNLFAMGTFFTYQTTEKLMEDQVFMNCMKVILAKQQTVFMNIHEILPEIHLYHNFMKHKATGRLVEVPKPLRSPCGAFKVMGKHRHVYSDMIVAMAFGRPCMFGNGRAGFFFWSLEYDVSFL